MTKRIKLMTMTSMMALAAGMAAAQVNLPSGEVTRPAIEAAYSGYDYIEIKYGPTQVKVEAIDNDTRQKIETVYDRATGAIIATEMEPAGDDAGRSGVVTKSLTRDFEDSGRDDNTRGDDDDRDDDTRGDDDGRDDNTSGNDRDDDRDDNTSGSDDNSGGNDDNSGGDDDNSGGDDD